MATHVEDPPTTGHSGRLRLLARVILGLTILGIVGGIWLSMLDSGANGTDLILAISFGLFPVVGYLLAIRRPDNAVSWVMLGIGAALGLSAFMGSYASYALHGGVGGRHLGAIVEALDQPTWIPIVALPATFLLLLFPEGHLPSPRWRWFARILGRQHGDGLPGDPLDAGAVRGQRVPQPAEPARHRGAADRALGRVRRPRHAPDRRGRLVGELGAAVPPIHGDRTAPAAVARDRGATVAILYALALVFSLSTTWATNATPTWLGILQTVAVMAFGRSRSRSGSPCCGTTCSTSTS